MSNRISIARSLLACALAVHLLRIGQAGSGAEAGQSTAAHRANGRSYVLESRRHRQGVRIPLPIGPSYLNYDYPYYYARGYYPRHIGGYVYYPSYRRSREQRQRGPRR